jgi:exopolysaccharide production protein ExoZ
MAKLMPGKASSIAPTTIAAVQILRATAALAVVFAHLPQTERLGEYRACGAAGVDIFFVISGFIMVYASRGLFATTRAGPRFLIRRLCRIVPIYWAATTVGLMVLGFPDWSGRPLSLSWIAASYLFLPFDGLNPILPVGWTLNYEMFFYVCFAAVICLQLERAVLSICILFFCATVVHYYLVLSPLLWIWTHPMNLEFAAGTLLGLFYLRGVRVPAIVALLFVIAGISAIGLEAIYGYGPNTVMGGAEFLRPLMWGLPALLIVAGAAVSRRPIRQGRVIKFGLLLGDASYGIYLMHPLLLPYLIAPMWYVIALGTLYAFHDLGLSSEALDLIMTIGSGLGEMIVIAGLSLVVFKLFERPMMRYLRDRFEPGYRLRAAAASIGGLEHAHPSKIDAVLADNRPVENPKVIAAA